MSWGRGERRRKLSISFLFFWCGPGDEGLLHILMPKSLLRGEKICQMESRSWAHSDELWQGDRTEGMPEHSWDLDSQTEGTSKDCLQWAPQLHSPALDWAGRGSVAPSEQRSPAFSQAKQKSLNVSYLEVGVVATKPIVEKEYKSQARLSVCLLACFQLHMGNCLQSNSIFLHKYHFINLNPYNILLGTFTCHASPGAIDPAYQNTALEQGRLSLS